MVFAVQCPNPKCRKFMLVEDHLAEGTSGDDKGGAGHGGAEVLREERDYGHDGAFADGEEDGGEIDAQGQGAELEGRMRFFHRRNASRRR